MALYNVIFDIKAKTASFESSMTRIERKFTGLEAFAKKAGATIGIALGGGALLRGIEENIAKQIELGDAMNKAAIKSGIAVEAFSELAYAAKQSDIPLEAMSTGLKKMQVAISTGAPIIQQLGINFAELRKLTPENQLLAFAQAISQLRDPADRTRAAVELFGKAGTDLLPMFEDGSAGIEKLTKAAHDMGLTLTKDGAEALGKAQDAGKSLSAAFDNLWRTVTVKTAPALTAFFDGLRKAIGGGTKTEILTDRIASLRKELESLRGTNSPLIPGITKDIADLQAQLSSSSASTDLSKVVGNTDELKGKGKAVDAMASAMDRLRLISAQLDTAGNALEGLQPFDAVDLEEIVKVNKELYDTTLKWRENLTSDQISESIRRTNDEYEEMGRSIKSTTDDFTEYSKQAARDIQSAFADFLFDPFKEGLSGMLTGFLNVMRRMVAEIAAKQILENSGMQSWLTGAVGAVFGGIAGKRAGGGPVSSGSTYLVGERGPELFTPGTSGAITPNGALAGAGGMVVVNNHYDLRGSTPDVMAQMPSILDARDARLKADLIDGINRGRYRIRPR